MVSINKKFSVAILSMVILFGAISSANAQGWRRWNRDNGTSKKEKAAWIGGGAAAGAVVGGLLGAGAGTATAVIKDRNDDDRYERYGRRNYVRNNRFNDGYGYNRFENNGRFVNNSRFVNNNRFGNSRGCRR